MSNMWERIIRSLSNLWSTDHKESLSSPEKTQLERCIGLLKYLAQASETEPNHGMLTYYRTWFGGMSFVDYALMLRRLTVMVDKPEGILRENARLLDAAIASSQRSLYQFLEGGDLTYNYHEFLQLNHDLCVGIQRHEGREEIESIHTIRLTSAYINVLEETLLSLQQMVD